jgi:putative two-component system response regulator
MSIEEAQHNRTESVIDTTTHTDAGVLVVDADSDAVRFLVDTLERAGFGDVRTRTDCTDLADCLAAKAVDLIVIDMGPKEAEGLTLLGDLQRHACSDSLPVLAIGPSSDPRLAVRALQSGARDYMGRPVHPEELLVRVRSLLEIRSLCERLLEGKRAAEDVLRRRTREFQESHLELLDRLARVSELRDDPSGGHPGRVGRLAALIAQELLLPADETRCLLRAAPLHDLGNVGIPDSVVRLEGNFTEEQREQMREHTRLGAYLLHGAENSVLRMAELIALNHHERWDGLGYPQGLSHTEIPMAARIVSVADALDAMTHPGQYKEPCSIPVALEEIRREAGWQFDPEVVAALVRVYERQPGMLTITPRAPKRAVC